MARVVVPIQEWRALGKARLWHPISLQDSRYGCKIRPQFLAIEELHYGSLWKGHSSQTLRVFFSPFTGIAAAESKTDS